jgi:hypothetical protein
MVYDYDDGEGNEREARVACGCRQTYYLCEVGVNEVEGSYAHAV